MELVAGTVNHATASLAVLERLLAPGAPERITSDLADLAGASELAVVATCLRFEIYAATACADLFQAETSEHLAALAQSAPPIRWLHGAAATRHLLRVTAGLESILYGETSVTHQIRCAYREAVARGQCGPILHRLFQTALHTAPRLRAETDADSPERSLPRLAVHRAADAGAGSLLILGAGRAGRSALDEAKRRGMDPIFLMGSRRSEVLHLAAQAGARAIDPGRLRETLAGVDAVVAASSRPRLIAREDLAGLDSRRIRPLLVNDLGMPRNVDPGVRELPGVALRDLADLGRLAGAGLEPPDERIGPHARSILDRAVAGYEVWRAGRSPIPQPAPRTVYLVGAGPGDPALLTIKAARLLRSADIVFHDALVSPRILSLVPRGTRRVAVGRRAGHPLGPQELVHRGMISWARRGARVVRLKGGDPLLFGRAAEEIGALRAAGLKVKIVPGITAATAAAASLGASLTRRDQASACAFVTAHGAAGPQEREERMRRLAELARTVETLAIYMGSSRAKEIARTLIAAGRDPQEPAAVVERASQPDERLHRMRLASLAATGGRHSFGSPAVILVGPTLETPGIAGRGRDVREPARELRGAERGARRRGVQAGVSAGRDPGPRARASPVPAGA